MSLVHGGSGRVPVHPRARRCLRVNGIFVMPVCPAGSQRRRCGGVVKLHPRAMAKVGKVRDEKGCPRKQTLQLAAHQ